MAHIKQAFSTFPIIIVSHTAKALGSFESDFLSPRGASAWTGDAQGVYTVFKDGETQEAPRILKATKVRFPTAYPELTFDLVTNKEKHKDVLGFEKDIWFSHSIARPLKPGEREQGKEDRKNDEETMKWNRLCSDMLVLVRCDPGKSRSYYERLGSSEGGVRGSQDRKIKAIDHLLNEGMLEIVKLDKPLGRMNHYLRVVDNETAKYGI